MNIRAFLLSALLPFCAAAADKVVVNGKLRVDALNKAYMESEWESLSRQLEAYLKSKPADSLPLRDRIAAYKYLGTLYAADTLTRARAETNFLLLFDLSPDIEIADLYVSNPINEFFQGVKRKHRAQKEYESKYDAYGFPRQPAAPAAAANAGKPGAPATALKPAKPAHPGKSASAPGIREKRSHAWVWWATGTLAVAALGAYLYLAYPDPPADRHLSAALPGWWEPALP